MQVNLVLGDQLVEGLSGLPGDALHLMVEDRTLAVRTRHHKQKLVLFFAAMRLFAANLPRFQYSCDLEPNAPGMEGRLDTLRGEGMTDLFTYRPHDDFFTEWLTDWATSAGVKLHLVESPCFLTSPEHGRRWAEGRRRPLMGDYYRDERQRLGILLGVDGGPEGGKWSYDESNRRPIPKGEAIPPWPEPAREPRTQKVISQVIQMVEALFPDHPGETGPFLWPVTRAEALAELDRFIEERLDGFGPYEDALTTRGTRLWHSSLSPALNMGLLLPGECVDRALAAYERGEARLESVEGFVRQIIGWREFIRHRASEYHPSPPNRLNHMNRLSSIWWTGETGLPPVDQAIRITLRHGWCHHIERLMVLGAPMLMCEVHPDEVHRWFMEMFVDSAEWVMAPNVYGMSQWADGGLFATKPYISGSAYILKMSDHPKGDWCEVWDGLYWRFIHRHREVLAANPRMSMALRSLDRLDPTRRTRIFLRAEEFIGRATRPQG
ncbi:MAG: cryptochrome/photolyase family protein [Fimbriimonadaceae bacterium]|nr:cryptochrome/photolyase family protein [Fimbriimonadaceae bacterium]